MTDIPVKLPAHMETPRLLIQRFSGSQPAVPSLLCGFGSPGVMASGVHRGGTGPMALLLKESGQVIGSVGIFSGEIDGESLWIADCLVHPALRGNGYAGEGLRRLLDAALYEAGLPRVFCAVSLSNPQGVNTAVKLGGIFYKQAKILGEDYRLYLFEQEETPDASQF